MSATSVTCHSRMEGLNDAAPPSSVIQERPAWSRLKSDPSNPKWADCARIESQWRGAVRVVRPTGDSYVHVPGQGHSAKVQPHGCNMAPRSRADPLPSTSQNSRPHRILHELRPQELPSTHRTGDCHHSVCRVYRGVLFSALRATAAPR